MLSHGDLIDHDAHESRPKHGPEFSDANSALDGLSRPPEEALKTSLLVGCELPQVSPVGVNTASDPR